MLTEKTGAVALALLLAACGSTTTQRAASGGLTGLGIGALAGGPIGAVIGGAVGGVTGWVTPESADTLAISAVRQTREAIAGPSSSETAGNNALHVNEMPDAPRCRPAARARAPNDAMPPSAAVRHAR